MEALLQWHASQLDGENLEIIVRASKEKQLD